MVKHRHYRKVSFWTKIKLFFYRRKPKKGSSFRRLLIVSFWLFILFIIAGLATFAFFLRDLPNPQKIDEREIVQSTKIYDRTGQVLLYDIHGEEKRTVIDFNSIPQYVKDATIVSEDANFYNHFGIDIKAIVRAFLANFMKGKINQGASTITQQFIKNAILTPERTWSRKIKEAILSIALEMKYSKDEILGFYLNQIPYGSNAYGIEAASMTFFEKHAKDLTLAESSLLAVLPQATTYFSPYGSHPEVLKVEQEHLLEKMASLGYITEDEATKAKAEKLEFASQANGIKAPHFVMYIREYLEERYGKNFVEKGGLKVYTTLDWDLQRIAERTVSKQVDRNIKNHRAYNAALVAIDPKTGQILSMVGSKDYFAEALPVDCLPGKTCLFDPNVNVTLRPRQPGSSFKPIAYATAFKNGFTPETIIFDLKTEFAVGGAQKYSPQNYDGKFRGPVTIRQALAQSLNVPSVKVLYLAGVTNTINTAEDLGISSLTDRSRYGLSLVLGGGEVTLLEETSAYGVFATEGVKSPTVALLRVEDKEGNVLEEYKEKTTRVLDRQTCRLVSSILSDETERAPVFGSHSKLYLSDRPAAAKTGTTNDYLDGWTVGYTPSLVVGVWAGDNKPTPMNEGAGIYVAAPIWNSFMEEAYTFKGQDVISDEKTPNYFHLPSNPELFIEPDPITTNKDILNGNFVSQVKVIIDKVSGKLATEFTPKNLIEEKVYQQIHNILYYIDKKDPQNPNTNGQNDPQFNNWEKPVLAWAKARGGETYNQTPPQEYDDIHTSQGLPTLSINQPSNYSTLNGKIITIKASASAKNGIKQLDFFFDNVLIGTDTTNPYSVTFSLPDNLNDKKHIITVRAYDNNNNRQDKEITVFLGL